MTLKYNLRGLCLTFFSLAAVLAASAQTRTKLGVRQRRAHLDTAPD